MADSSSRSSGISFGGALFLVFLVLKLGVGNTAVVDWSWWWVTAPLWIPIALALLLLGIAGIFLGIGKLVETQEDKNIRKARRALDDLSRRK